MWIYFNNNSYKSSNISSIEDMPDGVVGFVYQIYNKKTTEFYIGKKILHHKRTLPPLKGKKRRRVKHVESDWKTYMGSSDISKTWNPDDCIRTIHYFCFNKTMMSYYENKEIFENFEREGCVNHNVLGKFYKEKIDKYAKEAQTKLNDY